MGPWCVLALQASVVSQQSYANTFPCWKRNIVIWTFVPGPLLALLRFHLSCAKRKLNTLIKIQSPNIHINRPICMNSCYALNKCLPAATDGPTKSSKALHRKRNQVIFQTTLTPFVLIILNYFLLKRAKLFCYSTAPSEQIPSPPSFLRIRSWPVQRSVQSLVGDISWWSSAAPWQARKQFSCTRKRDLCRRWSGFPAHSFV